MSQYFKKIDVEIKGLTPLLMNRLNPESLKSKGRMKMQEYSTVVDAKNSAYMAVINGVEQLYIPQEALFSMIIGTAKQYRVKRLGVSSMLAGTMRIEPEKVPLGTNKYEVDERAVVIQNQRVIKGRAKLMPWSAKFQIIYDSKHLPQGIESLLAEILEDAGARMGLLDYRPQHKGWFGTFSVVHFVTEDGVDHASIQKETAEPAAEETETEESVPAAPAPKKRGRPKKA